MPAWCWVGPQVASRICELSARNAWASEEGYLADYIWHQNAVRLPDLNRYLHDASLAVDNRRDAIHARLVDPLRIDLGPDAAGLADFHPRKIALLPVDFGHQVRESPRHTKP